MGITIGALDICAAAIAGSSYLTHIAVGTGSSTFTSGDTALLSEVDRNLIDTYDLSTAEQVTMYANWSPTDISGCIMREFGTFTAGSVMANREVIAGSYVFDGDAELQIIQTIKFLIV
jgi:hypothetical protein